MPQIMETNLLQAVLYHMNNCIGADSPLDKLELIIILNVLGCDVNQSQVKLLEVWNDAILDDNGVSGIGSQLHAAPHHLQPIKRNL